MVWFGLVCGIRRIDCSSPSYFLFFYQTGGKGILCDSSFPIKFLFFFSSPVFCLAFAYQSLCSYLRFVCFCLVWFLIEPVFNVAGGVLFPLPDLVFEMVYNLLILIYRLHLLTLLSLPLPTRKEKYRSVCFPSANCKCSIKTPQ